MYQCCFFVRVSCPSTRDNTEIQLIIIYNILKSIILITICSHGPKFHHIFAGNRALHATL
jgi:hypothetical protein